MCIACFRPLAAAVMLSVCAPVAAEAAFCSSTGARFNEWKRAYKAENKSKYKANTWAKFDRLSYNSTVIKHDRNQKSLKLSFDQFYKRRASGVDSIGKKKMRQYKKFFDRAEARYGVDREVIAAIWGLETGFGRYSGSYPILQSMATLAYDCRRTQMFNRELAAAMKITDRRIADLSKRKGATHGEIGQTQMLPSSFLMSAVDCDGGGVNVWSSAGDVICSTANWLKKKGWRRGASYQPGGPNYRVIQAWNAAGVYQKTIAKLAGKMAR